MRKSENIVHEYRESDPEEQLHLFLDNPTLRNAFIEVELDSDVSSEREESRTTAP